MNQACTAYGFMNHSLAYHEQCSFIHELIHEFSVHEVKFYEPKHVIHKLLMNYRWFHEPFINNSHI